MRFAGRLHTWHEDRGFGFIRPTDGGQDIFVHASGLPQPRPGPGEVLTFEVALNAQGKKKAVNVRRQAVEEAGLAADRNRTARASTRARRSEYRPRRRRAPWVSGVIGVLLLAVLAAAGYRQFKPAVQALVGGEAPAQAATGELRAAPSRFRCDGRTHCAQMTSCEEATWFLQNCPGVQMDGDGDGVACEQQWCSR